MPDPFRAPQITKDGRRVRRHRVRKKRVWWQRQLTGRNAVAAGLLVVALGVLAAIASTVGAW